MKTTRLTHAHALFASGALLAAAMLCDSVTAFAQDTSSTMSTPTSTPTPAPSKISAVTVYTDRAIVTRTASVSLPAGDSSIVLEKLPAGLLDASVQVRGRGTASATILDVTTAVAYTDKIDAATQPRVKQLQDEIDALEENLNTLNDRAEILQQQIGLVGKIENAVASPSTGAKDSAPPPKLDDMQSLMTFSQDNRARLAVAQRALTKERADVAAKRDALKKQLGELRDGGKGPRSYKTVTVRVTAAQAGSLDLTVDYTVPAASWAPAYDARLRADANAVELTYNGIVRQSTGEDWKDVALTLSTARPGLGGGAPKNKAWFVDVVVPQFKEEPAVARKRAYKDSNSDDVVQMSVFNVTSDEDKGYQALNTTSGSRLPQPAPAVAAAYASATVDSALTSASFKIVAPASIASDNTPQKVSITTAKLVAKLQYEATPALQETAYLSANVTNTSDFPLLGGSVNVFLDDAFVATSQLKTVMPSEKFQLALGADEGVAIKRRVVNRFAENTGITGGGRRVTYEYLITVTNNKKTPARVVFTEALPISKNEKITVNLLAPAPRDVGTTDKPGKEVTREEDNLLWWRLDLAAGEKREIPFKFSIQYPGDTQVSGVE